MDYTDSVALRKNFGRVAKVIDYPHLIDLLRKSYSRFLYGASGSDSKEGSGPYAALKSVFPIKDFSGTFALEFVKYDIEAPKYSVEECLSRGATYEAPVKLHVRLISYDVDKESGVQSILDVKEEDIYFGTIPLMTATGTFIINGTERAVVSQLQRSPGVFFDNDSGKGHASGRLIYSARIIPVRGSWIDFDFDAKDKLNVRIDRRRKFPVTTLLRAIGVEDILAAFYDFETYFIENGLCYKKVEPKLLRNQRASYDIVNPVSKEVIVKKGNKISKVAIKKIEEAGLVRIPVDEMDLVGKVVAYDIKQPDSEQIIVPSNSSLTEEGLNKLKEIGACEFQTLFIDAQTSSPSISETLKDDKTNSRDEAIMDIYRKLRPSSPLIKEVAEKFFNSLFFEPETYDLSEVGRFKINQRLKLDLPLELKVLTPKDILETVRELVRIKDQKGDVDDIDHLGNRRVRSVGELIENQYRIGLVRMERAIRERMTVQEKDRIMPRDLVNPKPVNSVVKEFFSSSQLSQFMDQTNPLSEVTHKRRLSALGPGGLSRERAGFEVRDVHPTHYGRICPIETPEGPNIGLIVSLSTYARVNDYGFIETPYRKVKNGVVSPNVDYMAASEEKDEYIAPASARLDASGRLVDELVGARINGDFQLVSPEQITLMDVGANQLVSVSASMIPFLENDDANRALMGSNMQRQAVPLLQPDAPLVGTGMEKVVARDSGVTIIAKGDGWIEDVDAQRIVVVYEDKSDEGKVEVDIHRLKKFQKSNQTTTLNQKPIVKPGQRVQKGQVLVDGASTYKGELALGKNVVVAFMPWRGYNFEDAIIINENLIKEDRFTSIHIEEFTVEARDTKLGKEEITQDIPNVSEDALHDLDESGIVRLGAEVKPGDILVGKVTPKGETLLSPEEKLLRAVFGEKAGDVKDTSFRVPPGISGFVVDTKVFSRKGAEKDSRSQAIEDEEIAKTQKDQADELGVIQRIAREKLARLLVGKVPAMSIKDSRGNLIVETGVSITHQTIMRIPIYRIHDLIVEGQQRLDNAVYDVLRWYEQEDERLRQHFEARLDMLKKGDELPPGVIKMVKVYVAMKRKLSVGDKMAGRHGNKGVVSKLVPVEDMPYMEDGTPVDIILNPLGVPSRMNAGQILEVHLGFAAKTLGKTIAELARNNLISEVRSKLLDIFAGDEFEALLRDLSDDALQRLSLSLEKGLPVATPVFDGIEESSIKDLLNQTGRPVSGQVRLHDGQTGEPFAEKVTVGVMHMLKLHHLVDDKIHARSTGPYSLVTQQPLGGKAQFGGQRLGEMEVWAMEAYGAAHSLQEFLTVKSDDVAGRSRMYEKIVKGNNFLEAGLPESFNVLVKELQGLCMDMDLKE